MGETETRDPPLCLIYLKLVVSGPDTMLPGETASFSASIETSPTQTTNPSWHLYPNIGTITGSGRYATYTAPSDIDETTTVRVACRHGINLGTNCHFEGPGSQSKSVTIMSESVRKLNVGTEPVRKAYMGDTAVTKAYVGEHLLHE